MRDLYDREELSPEELRQLLQSMPRASAPADLEHRLMSHITMLKRAGVATEIGTRPRPDRMRGVAVALIAGLLLALGWIAFRDVGTVLPAGRAAPARTQVRAEQQVNAPVPITVDEGTPAAGRADAPVVSEPDQAVTGRTHAARAHRVTSRTAVVESTHSQPSFDTPEFYGPPAPSVPPSPAGSATRPTPSPIEPSGRDAQEVTGK